jgi:hypothetical protein
MGYVIDTAEGSCKEKFKTHNCDYKNEGSDIGTIEKYFPVIEENGFVKARDGIASIFRLGFYFFSGIEIFLRDDKDLTAGQTACAFAYVPVLKRYNSTAVWAVELNGHLRPISFFHYILET